MRMGGTEDERSRQDSWQGLIQAHLADAENGADALARALGPLARQHALTFLGADAPDLDDVVSEAVMAVLTHLTRRGEFQGNLEVFAATVVRNRCRNLMLRRQRLTFVDLELVSDRLADTGSSPLDLVAEKERRDLLQEALNALGPECANMLRSLYIDDVPMADLWQRMGLTTLSTAYYRRAQCLKKAFTYLNIRLADCSAIGGHESAGESPRENDQHE